jgi:Cdc6-like AAA superfamily ATPase
MLQSLLPIKLKEGDPSHQTVDELAEVLSHALENEDIRNIALTGPFGSGKSSIIQTLMEEHKEFHYLPISLATLQADEDGEAPNSADKDIETLNRKIEYSILQQIIYREKAETVRPSDELCHA